jgi:hypothetical protein
MFYRSILKISKVLRTSSVIVQVKFVRSFPYMLATATSMNLTNSSGVRLGITVCVAVIIVVMVRTVFLITHVHVFWKHASFLLLASAISSSSSFSSVLLSSLGRSSITTPIVLWGLTSVRTALSFRFITDSVNQRGLSIIQQNLEQLSTRERRPQRSHQNMFAWNCEPCLVRSTRMLFSTKQQILLEWLRKLIKTGTK